MLLLKENEQVVKQSARQKQKRKSNDSGDAVIATAHGAGARTATTARSAVATVHGAVVVTAPGAVGKWS